MTDPWILMSAYFDHVLNEKQAIELCAWIKQDRANAELFARQSFIHRGIYEMLVGDDIQHKIAVIKSEIASDNGALDLEALSKHSLWEELAEYEKNGKAVEVERVKAKIEPVLTEEERQAKIRAFIAEEKAIEEKERLLEQLERRRIRQCKLRRRQRIARARTVAAKVRMYSRIGAMAAVGMVIAYLLYLVLQPVPPAFVAVLTDGVNVKWADSQQPTELDSLLRPEYMKLVEGFAEITFDGGAKAIIEAPAEIELQNASRAYLQSGKMSATVPVEARGFALNTPSSSIIDLGTEFSVHVKKDGSSDIHVFKGQVSLMAGELGDMVDKLGEKIAQIVEAGQAKCVRAGRIQDIQFGRTKFVRNMPSPYELAVRQSKPFAYWRFNPDESETCVNWMDLSQYSGRYIGSFAIEDSGPALGDGRANYALKLGGDGYVVIEDVPADWVKTGYSIVLWIRPDEMRDQNIIANSIETNLKGNFRQLCIDDTGSVYSFVRPNASRRDSAFGLSEPISEPGQWNHIATSIDPRGYVRLFINGRQSLGQDPVLIRDAWIDRLSILNTVKERIYIGSPAYDGPQSLENELEPGTIGSLIGAVDEVALYNRPLSAEEIRQIYMSVKP